jgi:hypothetical protein
MNDLVLLNSDEVLNEFDVIKSYIEVAHSKGTIETSLSHMLGKVLKGEINVWVARNKDNKINCVGTTEILNYQNYKAVHLITLGGDAGVDYPEFHKTIEGYARWLEAKKIIFWGRKGWLRATDKIIGAKNEKYKETYTVMAMELD